MKNSKVTLKDQSLLVQKCFIGGKWVDATSKKAFEVHDPATGELIGNCPETAAEDAQHAIQAASDTFNEWRSKSGRERSRILRRWYELVMENKDDLATIITWENGKAKPDAAGEVVFSASFIEWFAEEAARIYGEVVPHSTSGSRVHVTKEPVGVCGLITPWNFPIGMLARKAAAALAAGCTCIIKTAGETPFSANALVLLASRAGLSPGALNVVTALENTPEIGSTLCESPIVRKVSFTGSVRVGRLLMKRSSQTLKKLSLELGGNAPFIVLDDADLDWAVTGLIASKFKCSGQTCVCTNRIFVQSGIYDSFVAKAVEAIKQLRVGSGFEDGVTQGPLVHSRAVSNMTNLVEDAISKGAKVVLGGKPMSELGTNFFEPTVITGMTSDMKMAQEEIFGPIAAISRFDTEEEVIALSNDSEVGLAAYVFTENLRRSQYMIESLHVGMVGLNTGVISDASSPFGGVKLSGLGREGSKHGIDEYLDMKTVVTGRAASVFRSSL
ncbi:uncharacterized protein K452DRAFT_312826 [Aplosporella prunicola CBS 121167]|uniref:Succinate-semialdehyde dehydrogenase n=1 Tax=Aplosporella prunicola CBS 121167 TaxID=1176127 RepID=A0A6A6B1M8_9PEZI|nr:uncharacterized protein K452DRAFT_312826 [Aplosporella prunicola CBS 121167]KAF2136917.1 hypothetical protein K452DRAFT_312826 [Aplosporella prunicola CBS 121167]